MRCATDRALCPGTYGSLILAGFLVLMSLVTWFSGDPLSAREKEADLYGADLVGERIDDWVDLRFVEPPHTRDAEGFRGQVLILRWWTGGCPFCETSAPVLSSWAKEHARDGLTVIGIYHPKPPRKVADEQVVRLAKNLELDCTLAVDDDWSVLEHLWLKDKRRAYTSASLLIDRRGFVRAAHRGGYLTPEGDKDDRLAYEAFAESLAVVLSESLVDDQ